MKEMYLNGYYLELYDSIDELPEWRFQKFNLYAAIDAGVGADLDSVSQHIGLLLEYNAHGKPKKVETVANNLLQSLAFIVQGVSPRMYCFAAMVKTVNGKPWEDLSQPGVDKLCKRLSSAGLTVGKLRGFVEYAKKNWKRNWNTFSRKWRARGQKPKSGIPA